MLKGPFIGVIHREDDVWVALCPELGTSSHGTLIDAPAVNLRKATELHLREFLVPEVCRRLVAKSEVLSAYAVPSLPCHDKGRAGGYWERVSWECIMTDRGGAPRLIVPISEDQS